MTEVTVGLRILDTLTSSLYEDPIVIFREYVQNSLDSKIRSIKDGKEMDEFKVTIRVDEENKTIIIEDNGYAISSDAFERKMTTVSGSDKGFESIGFRGIGRLSAMPFCKKLVFESKAKGENAINTCEWNGEKYNDLLNQYAADRIEKHIASFMKIGTRENQDTASHFFRVIINEYSSEIERLVKNQDNFKINLRKFLPLSYSNTFTKSEQILTRYEAMFNRSLSDFMCVVEYNGEYLEKEFEDKLVGESDLRFLEIKTKNPVNQQTENIGLLWFSFNKQIKANLAWKKKDIFGILVRSKNMLMGGNTSFADQALRSDNPFTTYDEMVAALRGISGELLIYSDRLKDNARRDWFRVDAESLLLRNIVADFLERVHDYRYAMSEYLRATDTEGVKERGATEALTKLLSSNYEEVCDKFFKEPDAPKGKKKKKPKEEEEDVTLSEKDIPHENSINKNFYDQLMTIIKEFMIANGEYTLFNKLRAHIKEQFERGGSDGKNNPGGAGISEQIPSDRTDEDCDIS